MSADPDDLAAIIADALAEAGLIPTIQSPPRSGHVMWGNKPSPRRDIEGMRTLLVQSQTDDWPIIATIRILDESDHNGHADLGMHIDHPRIRSMRWRIAEGYTNGFRKRDILWFALTRWRGNNK